MSDISYGLAYYQPLSQEELEKVFNIDATKAGLIIRMFKESYQCGFLDGKHAVYEDWVKESRDSLSKTKELINKTVKQDE